ncbi:phospholipase A2-like [Papilio machaon]|uniref:phospholipase A2-like n=1 Tax=Papilio machaon TaxID=76193 RepID=UPI001E664BB6|nr:phospholipase A2-like [Papilio machaon]
MWSDKEIEELLRKIPNITDVEKEIAPADFTNLRFTLIFPGTKWCGSGNIAEGYDDLGKDNKTDACCRQHDFCPDIIPAGETKYNLTNESFFTRLHCSCDETFRKCLRTVNSVTSLKIGMTYFNAIGTKCYRKDYPVTGCKTRGGWLGSKCVEYIYDIDGEMKYQWFDVPNY